MNSHRLALIAVLATTLSGCSVFIDAATSIAYDIESGARKLESSTEPKLTIVHTPRAAWGDCADAYRVQFTKQSALVVWCAAPDDPNTVVSSHTTTYHLNFVDVPKTTILDKKRGEPLAIDLAKGSGKPVVEQVY